MSVAASSSAASAVSGLGITFHPTSPLPINNAARSSARHSDNNPPSIVQHYHRAQPPRSLHHSISYDDGLNRSKGRYIEMMVREDSEDSSGQRRVRIASGTPEVLGAASRGHYQQMHHDLSPLSEFEHSSESDSQCLSPASLSSLPSSTNSAAGHYPSHYVQLPPQQLRHAQSMVSIPYSGYAAPGVEAAQAQPYPPQHVSYHRPHPIHSDDDDEPALATPAPSSRLPAFLRERRQKETLARPKSMLELGQLYALQSVEQRSQVPEVVHSRDYGRGAGSERTYNSSEHGHDGDDDGDDERRYGDASPESVPSSAGGLQRRNLERQLQQQQQLYQDSQRQRVYSSDRQLAEPSVGRQVSRARSLSMSATDRIPRPLVSEKEQGDRPRLARPRSELLTMRSQASTRGLEPRETGGSFFAIDVVAGEVLEGAEAHQTSERTRNAKVVGDSDDSSQRRESVISSKAEGANGGADGLTRQSTLLTVGANPVRRSKELDRLLAPNGKRSASVADLATISGSPTPSSSSSAVTASTRQRASSRASSHPATMASTPVILEQGKNTSKARVELDLMLESSLVVEGGSLKGRMEVRVRKPKDRESEVWVGSPKVRVVGFEELASQDARHIFYHHASSVSTIDAANGRSLPLPYFESEADIEGFHKGRFGQHTVPFSMPLPVGKGAKGGWKGKQGVVRYIVIASVKLKSENGSDRSVAHFYRHVEIYPYFNPAVLLAPALKPLCATASKGLFMGGSGKVNLSAKMHRATWVAGQRCYVDVRVENESSKKIKTLTLTLIRTTTVFRPRAHLNSGAGNDCTSDDVDMDADACQTQTTRKKVAESTLEMGKKANKGVTAKGSWMGVDGGENADFSHFLLVPPDALTLLRGRYLEVTYAIKVSVSGSLSADVSADIPIRVVNFVSLDPPPGHTGDPSSLNLQSRPLAKSWSIDQLRGVGRAETIRRQAPSSMSRMASLDSLRLSDLNGGRGPPSRAGMAPVLSRVASLDSIRTADLSRTQSIATTSVELSQGSAMPASLRPLPSPPRDRNVVGKALERQLNHQMSLDCISSAIASATARRQGHRRMQSGLRPVESSADVQRWEEDGEGVSETPEGDLYYGGGGERLYDGQYQPFQDPYEPDEAGSRVQLDDLDDVPDDQAYLDPRRPAVLEDDSEDELELDAVMQSRFTDDEDEEDDHQSLRQALKAPPSPHRAHPSPALTSTRFPVARSRPISPVKQEVALPKSAMKRSDRFAFATPSSPIKANVEVTGVPQSPIRRQPSRAALADFPAPPPRTSRPLPPRPVAGGGTTFTSPTKASVAREQAVSSSRLELNKKPSVSALKRSPGVVRKPSSKSLCPSTSPSLHPSHSPSLSHAIDHSSAPELDSPSAKSSPEMEPAPSPPLSSPHPSSTISVVTATDQPTHHMPPPSSPRKVKATPTLKTARSLMNLRTAVAPAPSPGRKVSVLPSVRSKIAALETRQAALTRLASTSGGRAYESSGMARANSITSEVSEASFQLTDLGRGNSIASFKAPMLRRKVHKEV